MQNRKRKWIISLYAMKGTSSVCWVWSLQSGYLTTLYSCDDCQRRVPISCVRCQASDPWLTITTVDESCDGALPEPLPDLGLLARLSIVLSESVKIAYRRCVVVCCSWETFSNAILMATIFPVWWSAAEDWTAGGWAWKMMMMMFNLKSLACRWW